MVTGRFAISSKRSVGDRVPTTTQVQKMSDKLRMSDRLQYVIGTLISIVLLAGYLLLSGDREEKPAGAVSSLQDVSVAKRDPEEAEDAEDAEDAEEQD